MKTFIKSLGMAILGGIVALGGYQLVQNEESNGAITQSSIIESPLPVTPVSYTGNTSIAGVDFTEAAEKTVHSVVHVINKTVARAPMSMADVWAGRTPYREAIGTGSGVIITPDGYIITNNHVIKNSNHLQVTLNNNQTYKAELIGADEESDIALIKIDTDEDLPFVPFGDSNNAKIGEWVLAVGNPFNLTSTVTAGIISAKGRDLESRDSKVQSFIQTDAAVNPGNSGGALVNTRGELIGINTAIKSQTGSYIGYSFAVPSNNARKIIEDFMEFGFVQKGMLGIRGTDLNGTNSKEFGLNSTEGIYVAEIVEDSGADKSDLQKGDVITSLDGVKISKFSELSGYIKTKNPGDIVNAEVIRKNNLITIPITISKNNTVTIPQIEMELRNLTGEEKKIFDVKDGVKITKTIGKLSRYNLSDYIVTKVNDTDVTDIDDIQAVLRDVVPNETLLIQMKNSKGEIERFRYTVN
ncbi:S1C family serine protease [Nonlabens ulvanivorans]|uniref:S1C family serine protease n=1 Tax=Nonlabens ulvanivorans TaxID=906888 RepID=UPI00294318B1|nr:trypsin-like peptidase domain-containing protein [Nonlabens ulvanivorans]WOI22915.1 trypsin-like peptidase domain-containing protein [Nonlabens ulvanivorans]